ncbi:hypothetical protein [Nonomuraea sp. NEAU-A123]|uniref:hypothetical protein n=1 Tax=Nonomuraea sp. NEAU-A123 TaxID=2839649 RepID=UPI001BE3DB52|nr:hypothetical protein [Nonomuraea sp. NEAU-A123]MBT2234366.1 hypothetical protein [Nonomuraea sp. NEAU-A123]
MAKRRLRTGPTAALPAKPSQADLLRVVRLADPEAREDGGDIVAVDVRVHAPVEAEPELVGGELEQVWACRVVAEGPLPFDYFDRYLAEGIAFRLGGLAVCRGEVTDPADDDRGGPAVILPVRPTADELRAVLSRIDGGHKAEIGDSDDAAGDSATEAATEDTPTEDAAITDVATADADADAGLGGDTKPDAATADADSAADVDSEAESESEADATTADTDGDADADAEAEAEAVAEVAAASGDATQDDFLYTVGDIRILVVPEKGRPPAVQELLPFATELTAIELRGDDPEKVGALALRLSDELNGLIVDRWRFRIDAVEDLLPPG